MACEQEEQDYDVLQGVADDEYADYLILEGLADDADAAASSAHLAADAQQLVASDAQVDADVAYSAWQDCLNNQGQNPLQKTKPAKSDRTARRHGIVMNIRRRKALCQQYMNKLDDAERHFTQ